MHFLSLSDMLTAPPTTDKTSQPMSFLLPVTFQLTWNKVYTIAGVLVAGAAIIVTVTWTLRGAYIEELKSDIASRKESSEWKVPETIKKLTIISDKLADQIGTKEQIDSLKETSKELENKNSSLNAEVKKLKDDHRLLQEKNERLATELKRMTAPTQEFTLTNGKTVDLVKNQITLGVESVLPSSVKFTINNESHTLSSGNRLSINAYDRICFLTVADLSYPQVTFRLVCDDPSTKG